MTRVVVHVDRLVVHGLAPERAARLHTTLRDDLKRELAAPGIVRDLAGRGGPVRATSLPRDSGLGAQVAHAIVRRRKP